MTTNFEMAETIATDILDDIADRQGLFDWKSLPEHIQDELVSSHAKVIEEELDLAEQRGHAARWMM